MIDFRMLYCAGPDEPMQYVQCPTRAVLGDSTEGGDNRLLEKY